MSTLTLHPPRASLALTCHAIIETFRRLPIRDLILAAAIVLAASVVVHADENLPDWIPDVLTFPDDAEVVTDRAVGSSIRLFSISTEADVDTLLADWEEELTENGYPVTQEAGELLDRSIEFTGPDIVNAKIIVAPTTDGSRSLIEFDATLN
ncbi:MAG: protein of unknown function containing DUF3517 domain [Rhodobacteraceae bacterium HLUCCO18]|nr:MAG: protein of unknown function containing DUF3517 domain [Rhodobacteraceae bacterium HLUCCO18]